MNRVNKYVFSSFISTFSSLFFTLFIIISIIFFIQISRVTAYIEVSFFELGKLYLFMLPRILLFCIPISYFVSLTMSLFKLSKENEMIVIFSLGYSPKLLSRFFIVVASILSSILLIIALVLIPTASELNTNFIDYKKNVAKLNLKPSEFGQKFSEWMIYISSSTQENDSLIYNDITMYNGNDLLITAKNAELINENTNALLRLEQGELYRLSKDLIASKFDRLDIRTRLGQNTLKSFGLKDYWGEMAVNKKRKMDFSTYTLIALFPLLCTLFAISLGVINQRYDRGLVYVGVFGILFSYFASIMTLGENPTIAILFCVIVFGFSGIFMFKTKILKRY